MEFLEGVGECGHTCENWFCHNSREQSSQGDQACELHDRQWQDEFVPKTVKIPSERKENKRKALREDTSKDEEKRLWVDALAPLYWHEWYHFSLA